MSLVIEINKRNGRILKSQDDDGNWWLLDGYCKRCGSCCSFAGKKCEHLTKDDKNANCEIHEALLRPFRCVIYPHNPRKPLYENCGFRWIDANKFK